MSELVEPGPYRTRGFASQRLVPPPRRARRVAYLLAAAFGGFMVTALLAPWQQNVSGTGRVVAYAPLERRQGVEAPVSGRIAEWFVQEGSVVAEGDPIVRLADNDPQLMARLDAQREATTERLESYLDRAAAERARLDAVDAAQLSAIASYEADVRAATRSVEAADQAVQAAEAALRTAVLNRGRLNTLHDQGLSSSRDRELAELAEAEASTRLDSARARAQGARDELSSDRSILERARADRDAARESVRASIRSAESEVASARVALSELDVRVSRQEAQVVHAPRAGTILRLVANQGGEQVSAGDTLAVLVPDTAARAVEVWVDGNDAALISEGRAVRIQFEGWPAVQFTGWPSVAVGTFGGRVAFVDSTDDGHGNFRLVVVPDPDEEPWPEARFLRQGVRANGWVLLERVSLGFELWRQINGFPPMLDTPPSVRGDYSGDSG